MFKWLNAWLTAKAVRLEVAAHFLRKEAERINSLKDKEGK